MSKDISGQYTLGIKLPTNYFYFLKHEILFWPFLTSRGTPDCETAVSLFLFHVALSFLLLLIYLYLDICINNLFRLNHIYTYAYLNIFISLHLNIGLSGKQIKCVFDLWRSTCCIYLHKALPPLSVVWHPHIPRVQSPTSSLSIGQRSWEADL